MVKKYRKIILNTIPAELQLMIKEKVNEFVVEIVASNSNWVSERRIEFLEGQIQDIEKDIIWWQVLSMMYQVRWFTDLIIECSIKPEKVKIEKILKEINMYRNPVVIDYDKKITDDEIEHANHVDCAQLLEIKKVSSGRNWALCPFHADKNPSLLCYPDGRGFYCFSCGAGGTAIHIVKKLYNYDFKEAVQYLKRF